MGLAKAAGNIILRFFFVGIGKQLPGIVKLNQLTQVKKSRSVKL